MNTILNYSGVTDLCQSGKDLYNGNFRSAALNTASGAVKGICTMGVVATTVYLANEILFATKWQDQLIEELPKTAHIEIFCNEAIGRGWVLDYHISNIAHCRGSFRHYYEGGLGIDKGVLTNPLAQCWKNGKSCSAPFPLPSLVPNNVVSYISQSVRNSIDAGTKVREYCKRNSHNQFLECLDTLFKKSYEVEKKIYNYCRSSVYPIGENSIIIEDCLNRAYRISEIAKSPLHKLLNLN